MHEQQQQQALILAHVSSSDVHDRSRVRYRVYRKLDAARSLIRRGGRCTRSRERVSAKSEGFVTANSSYNEEPTRQSINQSIVIQVVVVVVGRIQRRKKRREMDGGQLEGRAFARCDSYNSPDAGEKNGNILHCPLDSGIPIPVEEREDRGSGLGVADLTPTTVRRASLRRTTATTARRLPSATGPDDGEQNFCSKSWSEAEAEAGSPADRRSLGPVRLVALRSFVDRRSAQCLPLLACQPDCRSGNCRLLPQHVALRTRPCGQRHMVTGPSKGTMESAQTYLPLCRTCRHALSLFVPIPRSRGGVCDGKYVIRAEVVMEVLTRIPTRLNPRGRPSIPAAGARDLTVFNV
ncbi:hypothetical protein Mp_3g19200 [Marchantia polymorpha subsp. ruderalis]|uniref:Uncharacterized protein n=2 Tax=Marchantia polymorpha TaxID=3197 RepID=A0AAF6B2G9_MARPO|nr:hypothetical protein MARPO_0049s0114 [Marchantia polymorpha]BBN06203.1 hypothetical protein Mp_3g19200 [Marchantia polymorpha subsp. ruderalis]|eukprot:PTQ38840.1 hypothetical protein MARPO_0049s0114 [Marchantia polymorpha]